LFVESCDIGRIGVGEGIDGSKSPEGRVSSPGSLSVLVRHSSDSDRVLVNADERGGGVEQVERVPELDVLMERREERRISSRKTRRRGRESEDATHLRAKLLRDVESSANLLHLLLRSKRPETLELGVVKGEADGDDLGEEVERSESAVVIVDVVLKEEERKERVSFRSN